jgi:hypothetical protein
MTLEANRIETTYQRFLEIERTHDLFDLRVADVPVWERVRAGVFNELLYTDDETSDSADETDDDPRSGVATVGDYLQEAATAIGDLTVRNPLFALEYDIVFNSGRRNKLSDGVWWNIYCDPLCEAVDCDCLHLDPSENYRKTPLKTDHVRPVRPLRMLGTIRQRVSGADLSLPPAVTETARAVEQDLTATFGNEVDVTGRIRDRLESRAKLLPLFERSLARIDPEVALVISSYFGRETFVEACKRQDIPVVELQHGMISKYHFGYSYSQGTKEIFPDYFFSFGEFWTEHVDFPIPDDRIRSVGFPHFERQRAESTPESTTNRLLVISQPTIGDPLSKFALELDEHPDIDLEVTYKLHPGEYDNWREWYPWLAESDIDVVDADGPDLYTLFAESTAQVGVYSTAVYEGLGFDLQTFLLDTEGIGHLSMLLETGAAEAVRSADDVAASLRSGGGGDIDVDRLFQPNALETMQAELERLIGDHSR